MNIRIETKWATALLLAFMFICGLLVINMIALIELKQTLADQATMIAAQEQTLHLRAQRALDMQQAHDQELVALKGALTRTSDTLVAVQGRLSKAQYEREQLAESTADFMGNLSWEVIRASLYNPDVKPLADEELKKRYQGVQQRLSTERTSPSTLRSRQHRP